MASLISLVFSFCLMAYPASAWSECLPDDVDTLDYLATYLDVRYEVVRNFGSASQGNKCQFNLTNTGQRDIESGPVNWSIYLSHMRGIHGTPGGSANGTELPMSGFKVAHINGALFRLWPTSSFATLRPGQTLVVSFVASGAMVAFTDVFPNWYVATDDCSEGRTILSTARESKWFTAPFDQPNQWKRSANDLYNPFTAPQRYEENYVPDSDGNGVGTGILPSPVETVLNEASTVNIRYGGWVILQPDDGLANEAQYLADALDLTTVPPGSEPSSRKIILQIGEVFNPNGSQLLDGPEAYQLEIDSHNEAVTLTGRTSSGVFYAIQSLLSLTDYSDEVPSGVVRDGPRFEYRGMHIDVSRNFHPAEDIRQLIDAMTIYKMNQLHIHLSDDEGWRLEIPDIPELTQVGSRRCHDPTGDQCLMPQLGSGPTLSNPGTGYYTINEYKFILTYAAKRHVRVIPEFDMPGHSHAAINAMLARYRKYISTNETAATEFLLSDLKDESEYISAQKFIDGAVNPCIESTYKFLDTVIATVKSFHANIQPLSLYHVGGDEVPANAWSRSPLCQQLNASRDDISRYFLTRASEICEKHGVDMVAWGDGVYHEGAPIDRSLFGGQNVYSTVWDNVWEWGDGERAYELANSDYKVIISHATHLYFDHSSEADPEDRGLYWATRVISPLKVFGFMPDSIYENIGLDGDGHQLNKSNICALYGCPPLKDDKSRANIIGIQGQLWSEVTRSPQNLTYMIFPRLVALAERAWHHGNFETEPDEVIRNEKLRGEWQTFANLLGYKEFLRLDRLGVKYNIAPPGAKIDPDDSSRVLVTSGFPGLPVVYSMDYGSTWTSYNDVITLPPETTYPLDIQLRVLSADRSRSSRQVTLTVEALDEQFCSSENLY